MLASGHRGSGGPGAVQGTPHRICRQTTKVLYSFYAAAFSCTMALFALKAAACHVSGVSQRCVQDCSQPCVQCEQDLGLLLRVAHKMGVRPKVGVRAKLSTRHEGHWGSTSGEKAKFGLRPREIVAVVRQLATLGMTDCLQLLHFHIGSQVDFLQKDTISLICPLGSEGDLEVVPSCTWDLTCWHCQFGLCRMPGVYCREREGHHVACCAQWRQALVNCDT